MTMTPDQSGDDSPVAPPRRRNHRKSKNGCADCRKRRVKCDEKKPACSTCVRRDVPCFYPPRGVRPSGVGLSPASTAATASTEPHVILPYAPLPVTVADGAAGILFDLSDLSLLHHWIFNVCHTICHVPEHLHLFQRVFPEIGFAHPFLNHAILSISALHLAYLTNVDCDHHIARAARHQTAGLAAFQRAVEDINADNAEALFVWSLFNMMHVLAISRHRLTRSSSRKDLALGAEWIPMIRGIDAILYPTHNFIRLGRMAPIMSLGNWDDLDPGPPLATAAGVDGHFCRTQETWAEDAANAATYNDALRVLRKCRLFIDQFADMDEGSLAQWGYNRSLSGPIVFIHFAPQAFFPLLHQRQPPALVLFAFFGALMHRLDDLWFVEGLGREIVEVVDDQLGSYWRPWISWPLGQLEYGV